MVRTAALQQKGPGFGRALSVWDLHDSSHTTESMFTLLAYDQDKGTTSGVRSRALTCDSPPLLAPSYDGFNS